MKYNWEDLPEKKNCFTVKNTVMINLNTGKIVRHYSTNTRITVAQKCVTPDVTYYRTAEAAHHYLNYAFEASAFGLPNEKAPSAPMIKSNSLSKTLAQPVAKTPTQVSSLRSGTIELRKPIFQVPSREIRIKIVEDRTFRFDFEALIKELG